MIKIGRASDNQVVIVDSLVSRYHAELQPLNSVGLSVGWRFGALNKVTRRPAASLARILL